MRGRFLFPGACLILLALGAGGVGWPCAIPAYGTGDGPRAKELPRTGQFGKGLEHFDDIVPEVLHEGKLVGGALAIAKDGRLALVRGYGWANLQEKEPVQPHALFCLASVSKAITGVTVVKLVEEGNLRLDARVFDLLNVKPLPGDRVDPRLHQITVRDLLYHAGGWDTKKSGDAVHFEERVAQRLHIEPPVSQHQLIRYMMGQPLDFDPGTRSAYSNFGYVILLRNVIEHVTHQGYEEYVKQHVLRPMGTTRMRLEAPHPHYAPGEVRCYGPGGKQLHPGGHQHLRGPTGSWLASAPDMVRFLTAVDGSRGKGFLSDKGMQLMLAQPAVRRLGHSPGRAASLFLLRRRRRNR